LKVSSCDQIYGPEPERRANGRPLYVDAAAHAALLAIEGAKPGIFNIAEDTLSHLQSTP
jgi:hypothetical protein